MSSEVNFATMIVAMAIYHGKYQLVIDNNSDLANKFTSSKPSKVDKVSSETYRNNSFYSRSGFGLPKDPLTLATVLIDFQERQSHLTDSRIRYVLGTWVDICEKNNMSIGKAKRLFQFISDKNKYSPKLNVIFDNVWDTCIHVLDLSNRMEQNMKTHNRKLASKALRSYFKRVHGIFAHRRSRDE